MRNRPAGARPASPHGSGGAGELLLYALTLTLAGSAWLYATNGSAAGHAGGMLGPYWLRDATLALPPTLVSVWAALRLARLGVVTRGSGTDAAESPSVVATALLTALAAAVVTVLTHSGTALLLIDGSSGHAHEAAASPVTDLVTVLRADVPVAAFVAGLVAWRGAIPRQPAS